MSIISDKGRPRSVRDLEDEKERLSAELEGMTLREQTAVIETLEKIGGNLPEYFSKLTSIDYRIRPVSVERFLDDDYYIGHIGRTLYPKLKQDLVELFDGDYHEGALGGSIGWGKCLAISTIYVDQGTGNRRSVKEECCSSIASMTDDGLVGSERVNRVWKSGRKVCAKATLASGQWFEVSLDHRVRVPGGYRVLGEMNPGDMVAVARRVPAPDHGDPRTDDEVLVAAALVADGSKLGHGSCEYVKGDRRLVDQVIESASRISGWGGVGRDVFKKGAHHVYLRGMLPFVRSLALDCNSTEKRVPASFFGLPDKQLAMFLRWVFTDGSVYLGSPRKIEIGLSSEGLVDDLQALLRRFGIVARKSYKPKRAVRGGPFHDAWRLQIADAPSQLLFLDRVGIIPGKEEACRELREQAMSVRSNTNWDVVPIGVEELKEIRMETGPWTNKEWLSMGNLMKGSMMGTQKFVDLCEKTGYRGRYYRYVRMASDVVWDRVESIVVTGEQDVYEISVPSTRNMVINGGPIVHNSYFATCAMAYVLYQMSCLRHPQRAYGLSDGSAIYVAMLAPSEKVARRVAIQELKGKIDHSPYFRENFKHLRFAPSSLEIEFPNQIWVVAGSTRSTAIIGLNVFSGFIDECVVGSTRVLTVDGYKRVDEMFRGDGTIVRGIVSFNEETGDLVASTGTIRKATNTDVFDVEFDDGTVVTATSEHPFLVVGQGYVPLDQLRAGDEVVRIGQEAHERDQNQDLCFEESPQGETAAEVGGDETQDSTVQHQNQGSEVRDRCDGCDRRWLGGAHQEGARPAKAGEVGAEGLVGGVPPSSIRKDAGPVEGSGLPKEDGQGEAIVSSHRGVQEEAGGAKSGQGIFAFGGDQTKDKRGQCSTLGQLDVQVQGVRQYEEGWPVWLPVAVGEARDATSGRGLLCREFLVRALRGSLCHGWQGTLDAAGLRGPQDRWHRGAGGGQASQLWLRKEQGEVRGLPRLLQGKRVDLRGLGRTQAVARVVSVRSAGSRPTFDVMSVPAGNFIANGVVVHNTSFMGDQKTIDNSGKFVVEDLGEKIHKSIVRRIKSRFQQVGRLPGVLLTVSSKERPTAFIEKRIQQAKETDDQSFFVREYSTWDVKPGNYSGEMFYVVAGNEKIQSRILQRDANVEAEKIRWEEMGLRVIEVPTEWRNDFERDIDNALREIAGIATEAITRFMTRIDMITKSVDMGADVLTNPLGDEGSGPTHTWVAGTPLAIRWGSIAESYEQRLPGGVMEQQWRPLRHPGAIRYAHWDSSLTADCTGLVIAHIARWKEVIRRDPFGIEYNELAPVIESDLVLRIKPPPGDEIMLSDVRSILYQFSGHGFQIGYVSMDQYQCLAKGTLIHTGRGIIPIEEVVVGDEVQSRSGARKVRQVFSFGRRETLRVTTRDGDVLEGTHRHRIEVQVGWTGLVENEWGRTREPVWEWRRLDEIRAGDVVRVWDRPTDLDSPDAELVGDKSELGWRRGGWRPSSIDAWEFPTQMNPSLAEWLGLVWGDGQIQMDGVRLTVTADEADDAAQIFRSLFGVAPDFRGTGGVVGTLSVSSRWLVRWMNCNGLVKPFVPLPVLRSSRRVRAAFLRGLFAADGNVGRIDGKVSLSTKHRKLADQVRLMLRVDFGIESCLTTVERGRPGDYVSDGFQYVVGLRGSRRHFLDTVGFSYQRKQAELERHSVVKGRRKFVRVVDIHSSEAEVFDLEVDGDPSYVANGIVSHNSADALQKLRKRGIEAEVVSVDKTSDAYDTLKDAIYEGRVVLHPHPWLEAELRSVQRIMKSGGRVKIDHPDRMTGPDGNEVIGSKDVADALAGAVFSLTKRMLGRPVPPVKGLSVSDGQEKPDDSWVSGGKVMMEEKSGTKADHQGIVGGTPTFEPGDGPVPFIKG